MKRRVLLIGYNFYPEPTGIGKYSGEMIGWLAQNGYECEVITSYPYYPQWKVQGEYSKKKYKYSSEFQHYGEVKVKVNRCPMYVPSVPSGFKRILLDLTFLISACFMLIPLLFQRKFDYVITVVPCFQFGLLGVLYKKLRKAKLLYHIQDLQIEAARDLNMITSPTLINTLFKLEKYILNESDVISSISEGMVRKIKIKAKKDVHLFANWTDCKAFFPINNRWELKEEFGFKQTDKIILYSGAIGEKQGLEAILYAAKAMQKEKSFKFIICGSGPYKDKLCSLSQKLGLNNLVFFPLQPTECFNKFLNMADVHLIVQKATAGDLVMPSKLTTVLGVGGVAVITAKQGTGLHTLIEQNGIGILVNPDDQSALNEAIWNAATGNYEGVGINARAYAEENLSVNKIMSRYEQNVLEPCLGLNKLPLKQVPA